MAEPLDATFAASEVAAGDAQQDNVPTLRIRDRPVEFRSGMPSHDEHEHEPNLYETRVRAALAEYPYPLLTRDDLLHSTFTTQEVAEAMAGAWAAQLETRRRAGFVEDEYSGSSTVTILFRGIGDQDDE